MPLAAPVTTAVLPSSLPFDDMRTSYPVKDIGCMTTSIGTTIKLAVRHRKNRANNQNA
jgi:hypothetical protein